MRLITTPPTGEREKRNKENGQIADNSFSLCLVKLLSAMCLSLKPHSTAVSATVPGTLKYNTSQTPTVEKSTNFHLAVSKCDEDNLVGRYCVQEGYGKPITGSDKFSIHYALFKPSEFEAHFNTYDKGTMDVDDVAQLKYDSRLWMFEDVLGKKLGDKHLYKVHSGMRWLVFHNHRWSSYN